MRQEYIDEMERLTQQVARETCGPSTRGIGQMCAEEIGHGEISGCIAQAAVLHRWPYCTGRDWAWGDLAAVLHGRPYCTGRDWV